MDPPSELTLDDLNTTGQTLADKPTLGTWTQLVLTSSGQEWQFGRYSPWDLSGQESTMPPLLLTSSGQEWQFHIATDI